ncbi:MAG: hypothetical protein AAGI25_13205, partial [Bacteroidota bacterium]
PSPQGRIVVSQEEVMVVTQAVIGRIVALIPQSRIFEIGITPAVSGQHSKGVVVVDLAYLELSFGTLMNDGQVVEVDFLVFHGFVGQVHKEVPVAIKGQLGGGIAYVVIQGLCPYFHERGKRGLKYVILVKEEVAQVRIRRIVGVSGHLVNMKNGVWYAMSAFRFRNLLSA